MLYIAYFIIVSGHNIKIKFLQNSIAFIQHPLVPFQ